ncbi:MAG: PAS domain S-box protein [Spirochaetota bacterium]|nr:PAS domain S-box protein [Spirochaetota bacterium]
MKKMKSLNESHINSELLNERDEYKSKAQLIDELRGMRLQIAELKDAAVKQKADSLNESERIYRLISENTSDFISVVGMDGIYTYVSPAHMQLGYVPEDLLGKSGFDFIHPDDIEWMSSLLIEYSALRSEEIFSLNKPTTMNFNYRYSAKSGEWRDIVSTVDLTFDEFGKPSSIIFVSRDVTEFKRVEKELKKAATVVEMMIDGITISDMQGKILEINRGTTKQTGYMRDELVGKTPLEFIPEKEWPKFNRDINKLLSGESVKASDYSIINKNRDEIEVSINLSLLRDEDGIPREIIAVHRDITERKRAEEALRKAHDELEQRVLERTYELQKANEQLKGEINERKLAMKALLKEKMLSESLINSLPGVFYLFSEDGKFIRWNKNAEKISGYSSTEIANMNVMDFFTGNERRDIDDIIKMVLDTGEFSNELYATSKKGNRVPFYYTGIRTIIDNIPHVIGVGIDISEMKLMEQALRESEERYRRAIEDSPNPIFSINSDGIIQIWNRACETKLQYGTDIVGNSYHQLLENEGDLFILKEKVRQVFKGYALNDIDITFRCKDGTERFMVSRLYPLHEYEGKVIGCVFANTDITERKRMEKALSISQRRYIDLVESLPDIIFEVDALGNVTYANQAALDTFGYSQKDIEDGLNCMHTISPQDRDRAAADIAKVLSGGVLELVEYTALRKDGRGFPTILHVNSIPDIEGNLIGIRGIMVDITERKRAEQQLLHNAFHDELTGLPNRALFLDRLGHLIKISKRNRDNLFAVLFLDLDSFKVINDSLGHSIGDSLLIEISQWLKETLRPMDTIARLGGDEFAILLEDIKDNAGVIHVIERIQNILSNPLNINEQEIFTTASIGIAVSTPDYQYPEEMLRDAETAMYRAKALGRARYEAFDKEMHRQVTNLLQLETDLRRAIERREFLIYYQPVVSLRSGKISGFESLLRWDHPRDGLTLPDRFIPVLEETELIVPIGQWVLEEASRQMVEWQGRFPGKQTFYITVNISAKQFSQPNLLDQVKKILHDTGINKHRLTLEITESVIMKDYQATASMLKQLRNMNVRLAIDDFGTGYSSLGYLHSFPINILKIDHSFITRMNKNGGDLEIVRTIVNMAHNLGMEVVAEGIETTEQLVQLREMNCDYGQGYFFSHPIDGREAGILIENDPVW